MAIKFGTDGWRAVIDKDFNEENVKLATRAIAEYLINDKRTKLIIGYDGRRKAKDFAELSSQVMAACGIKVFLVDRPCSTPTAGWAIIDKKADGGIMFTASHNPPEFLGLKYMTEEPIGAPDAVTDQFIKNLAKFKPEEIELKDLKEAKNEGLFAIFDPRPAYFAKLKTLIDIEKLKQFDLKVLYNTMHGSGAGYLTGLLSGGKIKIEPFNEEIDPNFGGVSPEPVKEEFVQDAIEKMKTGGYDICLASDGDADRVGAIDEKGKMITSLEIFLLLAYYLIKIKGKRGPIVGTITHTVMVENFCQKNGLEYYEVPVGFKWVGDKMKETGAILGSEESGGSTVPEFILVRDSQLVHLFLLDLMMEMAKPISEILEIAKKEAGGEYVYRREDLRFDYDQFDEIKNVKGAEIVKNPPKIVLGKKVIKNRTDDGLKLYFEDGSWLLIRFSGTEPLLRILSEAKTMKEVDSLINYAKEYFKK